MIFPLSFLILVICFLTFFFLVSLVTGLSILLIFLKNQLRFHWFFSLVFLFSILLTSTLFYLAFCLFWVSFFFSFYFLEMGNKALNFSYALLWCFLIHFIFCFYLFILLSHFLYDIFFCLWFNWKCVLKFQICYLKICLFWFLI